MISLTSYFIVTIIALCVLWEAYVLIMNKETVSLSIWKMVKASLGLNIFFGFLMGHWFGPDLPGPPTSVAWFIIVFCICLSIWELFRYFFKKKTFYQEITEELPHLIPSVFLLFYFVGNFFW